VVVRLILLRRRMPKHTRNNRDYGLRSRSHRFGEAGLSGKGRRPMEMRDLQSGGETRPGHCYGHREAQLHGPSLIKGVPADICAKLR